MPKIITGQKIVQGNPGGTTNLFTWAQVTSMAGRTAGKDNTSMVATNADWNAGGGTLGTYTSSDAIGISHVGGVMIRVNYVIFVW